MRACCPVTLFRTTIVIVVPAFSEDRCSLHSRLSNGHFQVCMVRQRVADGQITMVQRQKVQQIFARFLRFAGSHTVGALVDRKRPICSEFVFRETIYILPLTLSSPHACRHARQHASVGAHAHTHRHVGTHTTHTRTHKYTIHTSETLLVYFYTTGQWPLFEFPSWKSNP